MPRSQVPVESGTNITSIKRADAIAKIHVIYVQAYFRYQGRAGRLVEHMYSNDAETGLLVKSFEGVAGQYRAYPTSQYNSYETTRHTIEIMGRMVAASTHALNVQAVAHKIWANTLIPLTQKSENELIIRLWKWITGNIKLVEDERLIAQGDHGKELLISPEVLLTMKQPQGDCDDFSMFTAAMLKLWGYSVRFVTGAAIQTSPDVYSHVWIRVMLQTSGEWLDLDCSHGKWLGWSVADSIRRETGGEILVTEWEV